MRQGPSYGKRWSTWVDPKLCKNKNSYYYNFKT